MVKPLTPAVFAVALAAAFAAAVFQAACDDPGKSNESGLAVISVIARGGSLSSGCLGTDKLIITLSEDVYGLEADDIKLNAAFVIFKHGITRTDPAVYELAVTPGGTGPVMVGLDPYNPAGWKWKAKTVGVYAVFHFAGTSALTITGYNGERSEVNIPGQIAGKPVIAVTDNAFNKKLLTGLTVPDTVKTFGKQAFANNRLENVDIPAGVKFIGEGAFLNNNLRAVNIPDNVGFIGNGAFQNNLLTEITVPESVGIIGNSVFSHNLLEKVSIPGSVASIGAYAFDYNRLIDIEIPENVTSVGNGAFANNMLKNVNFAGGVETITIGSNAFAYNKLESVTLPESLKLIMDGTFENNSLKEAVIPINVTSIGKSAFANNNLETVTIESGVITVNDVATVIGVKTIGAFAFMNNRLEKIVLPDTVISVGEYAFRNNRLTSITVGENVTLGRDAFGDGFEAAYYTNGKGVYTRDNTGSTEWEFGNP